MDEDRDVSRAALYRTHYRTLARACLDMSLGGFQVDEQRRRELAADVEVHKAQLRVELRAITPFDLFGKGKRKGEEGKGLSSPKVNSYFYDVLKCKPFYKRRAKGEASRTADEEAVRRLMQKYVKARPVGKLILEIRMWQKRGEFLDANRVDDDGRMRGLYVPNAVSGRLTCAENPLDTGSNMQNLPRPPSPVRSIFVPDHGHVLLEWDFSRIESRLLGGMSGDPRMMKEAQPAWTGDEYQDVADQLNIAKSFEELFGPTTTDDDPAEINQPKIRAYYVRQTGKRTKLAAGYGMQGETMSKALLLETEGALSLDARLCDEWLAKLYKLRPGIPAYQAWVRSRMLRDGYLENSWGRRIYFRKLRLADGDYRDGYAWCCQSEAGVGTNQLAFLPLHKRIKKEQLDARIVQQGHDALVVSCAPEISYDVSGWVGASMNVARSYPGVAGDWTLAVPVGYKLGASWGTAKEWKVRPNNAVWEAELCRVLGDVWWNRPGKHYGRRLRG